MSSEIDVTNGRKERFNSFSSSDRKNGLDYKELLPDAPSIRKAKEVLSLFAKAFASMRIYPTENPTVESLINTFSDKMHEFLDEEEEIKLIVNEFSITFKEETVFQDGQRKASLPFLFFKDGIRELAFYKGLDKEELQDFLKVIKDNADLPPDDSDIVNSLWIKDFPHIRYFAVDEFLDSVTREEGEEESRFNIDKEELTKGKIKLASSDRKELRKRSVALGLDSTDTNEEEEDNKLGLEDVSLPFQMSSGIGGDSPVIESMLVDHRTTPPMTEMVTLLFEILYMEDRIDAFSSILNILDQFYKEVVYKSLFALASLILNRLQELADLFSGQFEEKKELLEKTLQNIRSESSLAYLKKLYMNGQITDYDSFFRYLKLLGPITIPLMADIWEETENPIIRMKASNFLYELGKKDIASLFTITQGHRVPLTKEVLGILGKIGNTKALPFLKKFTGHENKNVRLSVIRALRAIQDEKTNIILIEYLSDPDGEVRTSAAMSLKYCDNQTTILHLIKIVEKRNFKERLKKEKSALLEYLARTQSQEVIILLRSIMKRWSIFSKTKQDETRLCAVPALEKIASSDARQILEEGAKSRNKTIRKACCLSLRKIAPNFESNKILSGEQSA
ncbi:MAG: HEAT repeat domain-containing protein [Candidatus Aminicenantes bacterium]